MKQSEVEMLVFALFCLARLSVAENSKLMTRAVEYLMSSQTVMVTDEKNPKSVCAGCVVTVNFVVTTCSCIAEYVAETQKMEIRSSAKMRKWIWATEFLGKDKMAQSRLGTGFVIHPYCSRLDGFVAYENDIGAIRLEKPFSLESKELNPITWHNLKDDFEAQQYWLQLEQAKTELFIVIFNKDTIKHRCLASVPYCIITTSAVQIARGLNCRLDLCPYISQKPVRGYLSQSERAKCDGPWLEGDELLCGFKTNSSDVRTADCAAYPGSPVFNKTGSLVGMLQNNELCDTPYFIMGVDRLKEVFQKIYYLDEKCSSYSGPRGRKKTVSDGSEMNLGSDLLLSFAFLKNMF